MLEDDGALAAEMLVQGNSMGRASQEASEPMLAVLYWRPSQIFAVDLKKVEGTQDYARVVAMVNSNTARPCRRRRWPRHRSSKSDPEALPQPPRQAEPA